MEEERYEKSIQADIRIPRQGTTEEREYTVEGIVKKYTNNLVIDIDHCGGHNIGTVTIHVSGKQHQFYTREISKFLDYIREGMPNEK